MLIQAIWTALERFYDQDNDLFKGKHIREECVNHRVALHIQESLLMTTCEELNDLRQNITSGHVKIDVEYDKAVDQKKIIDGKSSRPDLLIHHRGDNSDNYAFIELKKGYLSKRDIEKCKGARKTPYNYTNVLVIDCLAKALHKIRIIQILNSDGERKIHIHSSVMKPPPKGR